MDLGQAIRILRVKQGLTQGQLADRCGMSTNAICYIETGRTFPPKATLERLCHGLGIPMLYMQLAYIDEEDFPEEKRVLYRALLEPLRNELTGREEK